MIGSGKIQMAVVGFPDSNNRIYRSMNYGKFWDAVTSSINNDWTSVATSNNGQIQIATSKETIGAGSNSGYIYKALSDREIYFANRKLSSIVAQSDFKLSPTAAVPGGIYVVPGDNDIRFLGAYPNGYHLTLNTVNTDMSQLAYVEDTTYWAFDIELNVEAAYGGIPIFYGVNAVYSTIANKNSVLQQQFGSRSSDFGTDFEVQSVRVPIQIPKKIASNNVTYIKFELVARRNVSGNTGVISAKMKFLR
jgi:hypothetical protein